MRMFATRPLTIRASGNRSCLVAKDLPNRRQPIGSQPVTVDLSAISRFIQDVPEPDKPSTWICKRCAVLRDWNANLGW